MKGLWIMAAVYWTLLLSGKNIQKFGLGRGGAWYIYISTYAATVNVPLARESENVFFGLLQSAAQVSNLLRLIALNGRVMRAGPPTERPDTADTYRRAHKFYDLLIAETTETYDSFCMIDFFFILLWRIFLCKRYMLPLTVEIDTILGLSKTQNLLMLSFRRVLLRIK